MLEAEDVLLVVPLRRKRARSTRLECAECGGRVRRGELIVAVRRRVVDDDGEPADRLGWSHDSCAERTEPTLFGAAGD